MRWIATNAGVEGSIIVQKLREGKDANYGYNAATDVYEDCGLNTTEVQRIAGAAPGWQGATTENTECI